MAAGTEMMALRRLIISQVARNWPQSSSLFKEPSRQLDPSASPLFTRDGCYRRGFRKLINTDCQAANESPEIHDEADCLKAADDISAVKHTATSNLKTSTRHDLAMIFTCKVCETRSVKTASRESYEKGVVVARCGGCNNLHLIADRLGWFGEPGSIEDFLAARGEEVKRASTDTLNLTLEDLAVRSVAAPSEAVAGFDEMVSGTQRKYYMLGGKGGVGKTSCAASLAVKFANNGHPTLVVSTDPAHSLSDSFAQDLTGGQLVPVEGPEYPLFALEINPEKAKEEFRSVSQKNGGTGIKDFMDGMGLGILAEQLGELKLGELLDSPPPGLDEAIAISKVMQFLESQEYSMFTRIVFDTAPTGHTLRLLSLPDFLDASIGKILKLRQKIASATSAIKSVFGQEETQQNASDRLERLRQRMVKVRDLFRDTDSTEFVIVTIPTVMAVSESSRLSASLKKENVPVKRLVVNQVLPPPVSDCKFCAMKRKDQMRALDIIQSDPELSNLMMIQAPLVDVEIRGVPALKFLGDIVWK